MGVVFIELFGSSELVSCRMEIVYLRNEGLLIDMIMGLSLYINTLFVEGSI